MGWEPLSQLSCPVPAPTDRDSMCRGPVHISQISHRRALDGSPLPRVHFLTPDARHERTLPHDPRAMSADLQTTGVP